MTAMQGGEGIRVPDGAEIVGQVGGMPRLWVSLPADEDGFIGMRCPKCGEDFRLHNDDYEGLPESIWCVYCGLSSHKGWFETVQQHDRFLVAVRDFGAQVALRMTNGLSPDGEILFGGRPYRPQPLPPIDEERLVRVRNCGSCRLRYAVFGQHRYCPACGQLPAHIVAADALDAATDRLDDLTRRTGAEAKALREQGVFDQTRTDILIALVSLVETLAKAIDGRPVPRRDRNVFQRLEPMADRFVDAGFADLRQRVNEAIWQRLKVTWQQRHLLVHNDGVVDSSYLENDPTGSAKLGQRLRISDRECRQAIEDTRHLCAAIAALKTP
ncbi:MULTISPECIES: hypothetical protein [unclassified Micromonospora]|uniref:hypothetical protein n=1 Tax=unclassified Micromonospora TaxID=2617518 RepID=UPI000FA9BCED|nr:hypothetical protein [Micromonospora sp. Llam0]ROO52885.1 hypothetical protein EDC02_7836 [Micromonospora sp. Llam0]